VIVVANHWSCIHVYSLSLESWLLEPIYKTVPHHVWISHGDCIFRISLNLIHIGVSLEFRICENLSNILLLSDSIISKMELKFHYIYSFGNLSRSKSLVYEAPNTFMTTATYLYSTFARKYHLPPVCDTESWVNSFPNLNFV